MPVDKLSEIFQKQDISSISIVHMEVPCCSGIETAIQRALTKAQKNSHQGLHDLNQRADHITLVEVWQDDPRITEAFMALQCTSTRNPTKERYFFIATVLQIGVARELYEHIRRVFGGLLSALTVQRCIFAASRRAQSRLSLISCTVHVA